MFEFLKLDWDYLFKGIVTIGGLFALIYGTINGICSFIYKRKNELQEQFNIIVTQLTSENKTIQLSAAILLRRFIGKTKGTKHLGLKNETVNVISSLARVLPTGIFQKTLVDGIAFANDLSNCDFQKTNLQDVYLGVKNGQLYMNTTDMYLADMSYALVENVIGHNIIFYRTVLLGAQIKNSDFTNGNFRGADLTNTTFKNVILKNADFTEAYNIPDDIKNKLKDGICIYEKPITAKPKLKGKSIFFSMPGVMSKEDEVLTNDYKRILENKGYNVIYYYRDTYPSYGQFNRVRESIQRSSGMVAFGLKQIKIEKATYRPGTQESESWENKWLSTPWSEIEVGMALMEGLPILLVSDPEINNGVFDKGLSECFVYNMSTKDDCKKLEQNMQFDEWLSKV